MLIILLVFRKKGFEIKPMLKAYRVLGLISATLIYLQEIIYNITGILIYFVPINMIRTVRPASFFLEPAHFCVFLAPLILLLLIGKSEIYFNDKRCVFDAVFISGAVIISKAATGLLLIVVIWCIWFFSIKIENGISMYKRILMIIFFIIIFLIVNKNFEWVQWTIMHIKELNGSDITSGNFRVLRGYYIYDGMPLLNKIIGVGMGMSSQIINKLNLVTPFDGLHIGSDYMSAFFQIFVYGGMIGGFLYVIHFIYMITMKSKCGRYLSLLFFIMIMSNENLHTASFIILLMIIFELYDNDKLIAK